MPRESSAWKAYKNSQQTAPSPSIDPLPDPTPETRPSPPGGNRRGRPVRTPSKPEPSGYIEKKGDTYTVKRGTPPPPQRSSGNFTTGTDEKINQIKEVNQVINEQIKSVDPDAKYTVDGQSMSGHEVIAMLLQQKVQLTRDISSQKPGVYYKKGGKLYEFSPEMQYLYEHSTPEQKERMLRSVGVTSPNPQSDTPEIEKALEQSYGTLTEEEKQEYGYRYTNWLDIEPSKIMFYPGGKQYLSEHKDEVLDRFLQGKSASDVMKSDDTALFLQKYASKGGAYGQDISDPEFIRSTAWDILSKSDEQRRQEYFSSLPKITQWYTAGMQSAIAGYMAPITIPQDLVKLGTGKQIGPSVSGVISKHRTAAPSDIISTGIEEFFLGAKGKSWAKVQRDPVGMVLATGGMFLGANLGFRSAGIVGKPAASGMRQGYSALKGYGLRVQNTMKMMEYSGLKTTIVTPRWVERVGRWSLKGDTSTNISRFYQNISHTKLKLQTTRLLSEQSSGSLMTLGKPLQKLGVGYYGLKRNISLADMRLRTFALSGSGSRSIGSYGPSLMKLNKSVKTGYYNLSKQLSLKQMTTRQLLRSTDTSRQLSSYGPALYNIGKKTGIGYNVLKKNIALKELSLKQIMRGTDSSMYLSRYNKPMYQLGKTTKIGFQTLRKDTALASLRVRSMIKGYDTSGRLSLLYKPEGTKTSLIKQLKLKYGRLEPNQIRLITSASGKNKLKNLSDDILSWYHKNTDDALLKSFSKTPATYKGKGVTIGSGFKQQSTSLMDNMQILRYPPGAKAPVMEGLKSLSMYGLGSLGGPKSLRFTDFDMNIKNMNAQMQLPKMDSLFKSNRAQTQLMQMMSGSGKQTTPRLDVAIIPASDQLPKSDMMQTQALKFDMRSLSATELDYEYKSIKIPKLIVPLKQENDYKTPKMNMKTKGLSLDHFKRMWNVMKTEELLKI